MKVRASVEGLAIVVAFAAVLAKDTLVKISANNKVAKAGTANDVVVGRVVTPATAVDGQGTIETKFKELIEIKSTATIAAGEFVKIAAADGSTGENTAAKWVSGTDAWERLFGICLKGGDSGDTLEVLTY